ncbi:choice-of-anchor M domain-containing protein [Gardnerella vaginalis]|uniref:Actinobacterial surface-anchored protein n=1 Tax=Gardnerella vaginalis TaxID=2702 RepID=A0A133NRA9_GARVA|nr:choice-of-anchor M domain-containing protein [Gardnerella vaginalis]KXA18817.1 actinobacterial surface-anchored protein [Gardnerella vaginalis]
MRNKTMRNKTLICFRLISAILSAIISFGFLASMCCCNCGSAYASEAPQEETAETAEQDSGEKEDSSTVSNQNASDKNNGDSSQSKNEEACKDAVLDNDAENVDDSAITQKCRVYEGHTDAFATYISKSGKLVLDTRGDNFPGNADNGVRYNSSRLIFVLGENTKQSSEGLKFLPENGANVPVWGLSQNQEPNKLWPGFATETLGEKSGITAVRFAIKEASMPKGGAVYAYQEDAHSEITPAIGTPNTQFPHKMYVGAKAHMHVNWVFTKAGKYVLSMEAAARTKEGTIYKAEQKYTFEVDMSNSNADSNGSSKDSSQIATANKDELDDYRGFVELKKQQTEGEDSDAEESEDSEESEDEDDEDSSTSIVINGNNNRVYVTPWPGAKPKDGLANHGSDESDDSGESGESGENGTEGGAENAKSGSKGKNKKQKTVKKCLKFKDLQGDKLVIKHGHVDLATYSTGNGIGFAVQEDVTGSHVKRDPSKVVFYAGKSAKDGNVWRLPQTQKGSVPWVGWSNQNLSPHKPSKISLKSVKGPGSVRIWLQGGLGVKAKTLMSSGGNSTYTIPANTHMHLNWDFSKSGYYTIRLAVSANGKTLAKDFHFAIGVDPLEKPMSCSAGSGEDGDGGDGEDVDGQNGGQNNGQDGSQEDGDGKNVQNDGQDGGQNGGSTALAGSYSGGGSSFFGGRSGLAKSAKSGKTGRSVSISGGTLGKSKGLQSKYSTKRIKGLSQSLKSGVKSEEPSGIIGLFQRKPVVAYTALSLGIASISGTCAAGLFVLRKRGLIPAGGLFSALMGLK